MEPNCSRDSRRTEAASVSRGPVEGDDSEPSITSGVDTKAVCQTLNGWKIQTRLIVFEIVYPPLRLTNSMRLVEARQPTRLSEPPETTTDRFRRHAYCPTG